MAMQSLIVFVVVALCFAYAAWSLLPQAVLRGFARRMQRLPLPAFVHSKLLEMATTSSGCHCSACEHAQPRAVPPNATVKVSAPGAQVLVFHPRKPR
jgi:hypothetical protein